MVSVSRNGKMAYVSNERDNKRAVYFQSAGAKLKPLFIGGGSMPLLSMDGKRILYEGSRKEIFLYDLSTRKQVELGQFIKLEGMQSPVWSASGKEVIFSAGSFPNLGIYSINIKTKTVSPMVTDSGMRYGCVPSPDGKKMAYRCVKGNNQNRQRGIVVLDLITKDEKYITGIGEYCKWSPDGKKLAFHWPDSSDYCIYTVNADGTELKKIAGKKGIDFELPAWSPDGNKIYFQLTNSQGNWEIWVMDADGSDQRPVIPGRPVAGS
jgi:Tol biopolymer transport system component